MSTYKLMMSIPAVNDLQEISRYIAKELQEPETAEKLIARFKRTVMSLSELPTRYPCVTDRYLASLGIRRIVVDHYLVFYLIHKEKRVVSIIRILYGKRNWEHLL
ncbi:type II toxin-antitoxin system RelE/ParE family toxin [Sporolactobacillus sp. STSJ-5]|uniref:type II toxin-antitoxin system RelE/ParE family toxin n=1 Tax=Sporolactobacillus sp. STSJ-5 TaxID=2965076 RepID=UPI0021069831|nr:type II toxin-antitoxin system RelE/ParE family toxin [Sporolactobacillus sp. STSJ-5]MCQ2010943.1 type II toxin-antitoxin system RelE/ParE family toxin [Sporolactobacillus sp. STSJ-5]